MAFSFRPRKRAELYSLSEEDIRSRLYGSAVGIATDSDDNARHRKSADKSLPEADKDNGSDRTKIFGELASLKTELEQAKKRLNRMKGVNAKKMRLITVSFIVIFLVALLGAVIARKVFFHNRADIGRKIASNRPGYTVQVAVSENLADAERLRDRLRVEGYNPFIRKSLYPSGKYGFTTCVGSFRDRRSAEETLNRLRSKEGIEDSFIVNIPE